MGRNTKWEFTEKEDKTLIDAFNAGKKIKQVVKRSLYNKPYTACLKRLHTLGYTSRSNLCGNHNPWCDEEIKILESYSHTTVDNIQKRLRGKGYHRSLLAISTKKNRIGLTFYEERLGKGIYSALELSKLMNVHESTIKKWSDKGLLKHKRVKRLGQHPNYLIKRKDLLSFIVENLPEINIAKMDKFWLVDVLTGGKLGKFEKIEVGSQDYNDWEGYENYGE